MSAFSINTWLKKGYSEEQARYQIAIRRPNNVLYYINKGFTEEEAKEKIRERQSLGGLKRANMTIKEKRTLSPRCVEFYTAKGFSEEEAKELVSEFQSVFSKEKCIEKYGNIVGLEIFNDRQEKWQATLKSKPEEVIKDINRRKNRWIHLTEEESELLKKQIAEKIKETVSSRSVEDSRRIGQTIRAGQVTTGRATPEEMVDDFLRYKQKVWAETKRNDLTILENYDRRSKLDYHLDHMYSIFEGFRNNVDPYIIGHIENLRMLPYKENLSKFNKCSITLNELMLRIEDIDASN